MQTELQIFIDEYVAAWRSPRFRLVIELWDPAEAEPWHFPEEIDQPLIGREAIENYLEAAAEAIAEFSVAISDAQVKELAEDLFVFRWTMRWRALMQGNAMLTKPLGASVQVSGVLRRTPTGLKLAHYMEAGPAALPYLISQYEKFAEQS